MVCYAEITKQIKPTEGNSGLRPFCVTTSVGFSCWSNIMENVKKCSKCKKAKPFSEFHKNKAKKDGFQDYCKICTNTQVKKYLKTEKGRESRRQYYYTETYQTYQKVYRKKYQRTDGYKELQRKYRQTEKGKIVQKNYRQKYKLEIRARRAISNAIRDGKITRPDVFHCLYCFMQAQEYHHYLGYEPEHWFDVIPVCVPCHWEN